MSILLLNKTFETDRIRGEQFRMDPALIRSEYDPPFVLRTSYWDNSSVHYPPFFGGYGRFQDGWTELADSYQSSGDLWSTDGVQDYYKIHGYRFCNFISDVEFSFDVDIKAAWYEQVNESYTNTEYPQGNFFRFRVHDCTDGSYQGEWGIVTPSALVYVETVPGYQQKTITYTIPAGPHCLIFEYIRDFLQVDGMTYDYIGDYGGNPKPSEWVAAPPGVTPDNTCTLSNFTPIAEPAISISCPAVGEAEDTATQPEIDISFFDVDLFDGLLEALTGDIITMASPSGMSGLVFHALDDVAEIEISAYPVGNDWTIPAEKTPFLKTVYVCILTGAEDGLDDYELPCSSLSATRRNGKPSYLSVVIPNITEHQAAISARPNGDIEIYKGFEHPDGTRNLEKILDVNFSHLLFSKGARSQSGSVVGYRQKTYSNPVERSLSGVFFRGMSQAGTTSLKSDVDLFVSPGDTCVYGDTEFTIDFVRYTISPRLAYMEVVE